ncbi:MAG: nucleotidyltransferase substrate binding protein [Clostridiales bacterium]|nr:nucleotidyltransferase substrate binding protein [Clostridiales bacterium]
MVGIIGLFRLCFNESQNMMKEVLEKDGYCEKDTYFPKTVLKTAYYAGMIDDEELWLSALKTSNNVLEAYNQDAALNMARLVKEQFYDMFVELKVEIDTNWKTI